LKDIDQATQYYEDQLPNLGIRFKKAVSDSFNSPQIITTKYDIVPLDAYR
jgi:hypothetical protein